MEDNGLVRGIEKIVMASQISIDRRSDGLQLFDN